jgi:signal peptidase II
LNGRRSGRLGTLQGRRLALVVLVAGLVVVCDQVTKALAIDELSNGPVHLLGPLSLVLAFNTGIAFSIGAGFGLPIVVLVIVVIGLLVYLSTGATSRLAAVAIGLVLGGALSNLGDRLFRARGGAVVDFIHTGFWPTFNVADASIVVGCALLLVTVVGRGSTEHRLEHEETDAHDE